VFFPPACLHAIQAPSKTEKPTHKPVNTQASYKSNPSSLKMPPQHFNRNAVLRDLADSNDFFDELVDSIPAKLYVAGNTGALLRERGF
jgi:hypothetical protein